MIPHHTERCDICQAILSRPIGNHTGATDSSYDSIAGQPAYIFYAPLCLCDLLQDFYEFWWKICRWLAISAVFFYYVGRHLMPCRLTNNREVYGSRGLHFDLISQARC